MEHPPRPAPDALNGTVRIPYLFVLDELEAAGNGDAGVALWQMLRNVRGRLDAVGEAPGGLAMGESPELMEAVPELTTTLRGMVRLLRDPHPDHDTRDGLVLGCAHLGLWAEGVGACRTALSFFALAEELDPARPHLGYHIGRLARKLALYDLAEPWLRWAHRQARGAGEWEVAALALSGLGNLHRQRGNLPLARRFHGLCLRTARRHDLRTLEGDAHYDLAGMSFDADEEETAMRHVAHALAAYGPGHGRVYALAHDVAWFWMERSGRFEDAVILFTALADHLWEPRRRLALLANLARAAAGARWNAQFESAWNETWSALRHQPSQEGHASALSQLSIGAGTLRLWQRAEMAAREALKIARERREEDSINQAEALLAAAHSGAVHEDELSMAFFGRRTPANSPPSDQIAETGDALVSAMRGRQDDAPRGPAPQGPRAPSCSPCR